MERALNILEINKISGHDSPVLIYPELEKYKNIYQIFKDKKCDNFILLYQTSDNFGHWCLCFLRDDGSIEFYDPYGETIDTHLSTMKDYYGKAWLDGYRHDYFPHLTRLLLNTPKRIKIHYNNYPHQKYDHNVATCGRHCGWRLLHRFLNIDEYTKLFGKKNIDKKIVYLTDFFL